MPTNAPSPFYIVNTALSQMDPQAKIELARNIICAIIDPAFDGDISMASRAIAEHSHNLSRAAFEAECG